MKYRADWNVPPPLPIPEDLTRAGYTPLLATVLAYKGITSAEAAADFLRSGPYEPEDPFLLTDMQKAVDRIRFACRDHERVAVFGDYDVDGITSGCLVTDYLRSQGLETELYIPNRLDEGYGINIAALRQLREKGVSLVVTVDCGITAAAETEFAASLGMDVVVTDHHECPQVLPQAVAVVDPKRPDSSPAGHDLAGVGVAFKLICALTGDAEGALRRYADLVAVGTIADVMPLTGENRQIVKAGLDKLRRNPRPGFSALMAEAGVQPQRLSASTVGFTLAPRINAAGRLGSVQCAAGLMLETDRSGAAAYAAALCRMNRQRQSLEASIWAEAEKMLEGQELSGPIVLASEGWHQGVIGIVASRLVDAHHLPTIMISLDGDAGKGSCRSYGDFNLFDALSACRELLDGFGGHALAAGLNISRDKIGALRQALNEYYTQNTPNPPTGPDPDIFIHSGELLTIESVRSLDTLEPFGSGNPQPDFCLTDAQLVSVTAIGGGKHTSLRLEKFGQVYDCVWFSQKADELDIALGSRVDAVFSPQISDFRGRISVQLHIHSLRRADTADTCRHLLSGGELSQLSLDRQELAYIWRSLEKLCPVSFSLKDLHRIAPHLHSYKIALGLRVLSELSLIHLCLEPAGVSISLADHEGKADLTQSPAWRNHQH